MCNKFIWRTIIGKEFNGKNEVNSCVFVKLTMEDNTRRNFEYREGLIVDTIPFNPTGECLPGGMYFTDLNDMPFWINYGPIIWTVTIPKNAWVYVEEHKLKADQFELSDRKHISEHVCWCSKDYCLMAVKKNGLALQYVGKMSQTLKICKAAVEENHDALIYIQCSYFRDLCREKYEM